MTLLEACPKNDAKSQSLGILLQDLQNWRYYAWEYEFLQSGCCYNLGLKS